MAIQKHWAHKLAAVMLAGIVAFGAILAAKPTTAKADWVKYNGAYYYQYNNGKWAKDTWVSYKGTWYYIGSDYKVAANRWVAYDDTYFYLGKDGKALTDTWLNYKGSWYYFYENGGVVTDDIIECKDAYYGFGSDGKLVVGGWFIYFGNSYYYAGKDGKLITDKFFKYNNAWYYFDEYGWLVCDYSILYDGYIYTFDSECRCIAKEPAGEPTTIEPQVILDSPYYKVTVTDLLGYMVGYGPELFLSVENKTNNKYELQITDVCVNGWNLNTGFYIDTNPGTTENSIEFDMKQLKKCNVTEIAEIEFKFAICDVAKEEIIYTSPNTVRIETSAAATYEQTYDDSGVVIIDSKGLKVVSKGLISEDAGKGFALYIFNETGYDIGLNAVQTTINGIEINGFCSGVCLAGKHTLTSVIGFEYDLEEAGITDIQQMKTIFDIYDTKTGDKLGTTKLITLVP